jgi:hypothetical protein
MKETIKAYCVTLHNEAATPRQIGVGVLWPQP